MSFHTDLKYAVRTLRNAPSFSAIVVLILGLGIGATTAVFSVIDALLLTPLPYRESDRLVALWQRAPDANVQQDWLSPGQYTEILEHSSSFEELALFYGGPVTLSSHGPAEEVGFLVARASFFRVLGAKPRLGRLFTEGDDRGDAPVVAVLTHELWQRRYGGDPDIVGKSVGLDILLVQVVGVLEPGLTLEGEVFPVGGGMKRYEVVLSMPRTRERMGDWETEGCNVAGKLRRGVSERRAQAEMDVISHRLRESGLQQLQGASVYVDVVPLLDQVVDRVRNGLWMLLGAASLLLLIACMNTANLILARGASRRREMGISAAIGAGRAAMAARLLTESMLLAGLGCLLGVGLAWGSVTLVRQMGSVHLPRSNTLGVDGRTLALALILGLVTTVASSLVPALRASGVHAHELIRGPSPTHGVLPKRMGSSSAFAVVQIAMAFVLLIGAGLLLRSFARLLEVDPGFEPRGRLTLRLQEPASRERSPEEARAVASELFQRIRALPGVRAVASATPLPFGQGAIWGPIEVEGFQPRSDEAPAIADRRFVSPGYFEAMGIRLVSGRLFEERDARSDARPVRIVDRPFAEHFWPGGDALGKWIGSEHAPFPENRRGRVVGIVEPVRHYALEADGRMTVYLPAGEINRTYLIVHADRDPNGLAQPVVDVVHGINRQIVVTDVRTMDRRLADATARRRLGFLLMQSFAGIALVLAAVGLYGVIAHGVSRGTPEIGIRMSLGASPVKIVRFVLGYGVFIASLGLAIGLAASLASTRLMESFLYGVTPVDFATYAGIILILGSVCALACWIPARRAGRVAPLVALRSE
jgi:predicted permease